MWSPKSLRKGNQLASGLIYDPEKYSAYKQIIFWYIMWIYSSILAHFGIPYVFELQIK